MVDLETLTNRKAVVMRWAMPLLVCAALGNFGPGLAADDDDSPFSVPAGGISAKPSLDERLLFLPVPLSREHRPPNPPGVDDVWLTAPDGVRLHAWWLPHERPVAHILYLHGNSGNLWSVAQRLQWLHDVAECAVLAVDYRGYGLSEGTPTVDGVLCDIRAARKELCRRSGCLPGADVLIGRSLGGALAIDLAAEKPPRGLVLESTFLNYRAAAQHHAGRLAALIPEDRLDSQARLPKYPGPLLQMHGDADRIVPFEQGRALHEVARGPKQFVVVPGKGHSNTLTPEYLAELRRFLRDLPK